MNLRWYFFQSLVTLCCCTCINIDGVSSLPPLTFKVAPAYSELTFPYLTLLRVNRLNWRHPSYCTGAAISSNYILTTTHCVWPLAYNIHAFNGYNLLNVGPGPASPETTSTTLPANMSGGTTTTPIPPEIAPSAQGIFSVEHIKKHPMYIPPMLAGLGQSDVALVRVKGGGLRTQLSVEEASNVKLLREGEPLEKKGEFFLTAGWHFGSDPSSTTGNSIHLINVTLVGAAVCREHFRFYRDQTMLCFKPEDEPKPLPALANVGSKKLLGPCHFDVGAPVVRTFQGPYSWPPEARTSNFTFVEKANGNATFHRPVYSNLSGPQRRDTIVGVISAVNRDCALNAPFVATKVSEYADWVARNSNE